MWDTRDEEPRGEGAYGYDAEAMFRDLEKVERDLEDERVVIRNLKRLLDGDRDLNKKLKEALNDCWFCLNDYSCVTSATRELALRVHEELDHGQRA